VGVRNGGEMVRWQEWQEWQVVVCVHTVKYIFFG
jgi:hypothetical protein